MFQIRDRLATGLVSGFVVGALLLAPVSAIGADRRGERQVTAISQGDAEGAVYDFVDRLSRKKPSDFENPETGIYHDKSLEMSEDEPESGSGRYVIIDDGKVCVGYFDESEKIIFDDYDMGIIDIDSMLSVLSSALGDSLKAHKTMSFVYDEGEPTTIQIQKGTSMVMYAGQEDTRMKIIVDVSGGVLSDTDIDMSFRIRLKKSSEDEVSRYLRLAERLRKTYGEEESTE